MSKPSERPESEARAYAIHDLEVRAARADDGSIPIRGYAAVFDSRSNVIYDPWIGTFREEIERGAFKRSLDNNADVRLLFNHKDIYILARTRSGTLRLSEDDHGLHVDADMAAVSYAQDLAVSLQRGDVSQMSFAFRVIKDTWNETEDGLPLRRVQEAALIDTSIVVYPAYEETTVGLRSLQFESEDEIERFLMDLIQREVTPARLPVLRLARQALDRQLAIADSDANHSAIVPLAVYRKKQALMAQKAGF